MFFVFFFFFFVIVFFFCLNFFLCFFKLIFFSDIKLTEHTSTSGQNFMNFSRHSPWEDEQLPAKNSDPQKNTHFFFVQPLGNWTFFCSLLNRSVSPRAVTKFFLVIFH